MLSHIGEVIIGRAGRTLESEPDQFFLEKFDQAEVIGLNHGDCQNAAVELDRDSLTSLQEFQRHHSEELGLIRELVETQKSGAVQPTLSRQALSKVACHHSTDGGHLLKQPLKVSPIEDRAHGLLQRLDRGCTRFPSKKRSFAKGLTGLQCQNGAFGLQEIVLHDHMG